MGADAWTEMRAACLVWRETRPGACLVIPRFTPLRWHECDVLVVMKGSRYWHEYEIKLSIEDFRADRRKVRKHQALEWSGSLVEAQRRFGRGVGPNRFWYVVPEDIAERVASELPPWAGLAVLRLTTHGTAWLDRRVKAPLRHSEPVDQRVLDQAHGVMIYRMWAALTRLAKMGEPSLWDGGAPEPDEIEAGGDVAEEGAM